MKKTTKSNAPAREKAAASKKTPSVATSPTPAPAKSKSTTRKTPRSAPTADVPATTPRPPVPESVPASDSTPPSTTRVLVRTDVGFGNALHLRGVGPGLSWERGVPLECVSADTWTWFTTEADRPVVFKVLLNDSTWCAGEDLVVEPGATIEVIPSFN